ncbi:interferon phi 2 [Triplophysa rosa]|uniref:Interferon phi 2 n=1 Tax=Triplophysa rosa TaxID=992332 RepID=A0A9W7TW68_TRIRA|nr:interferon phi 2 [Triplophysa rosa]KAI7803334.1 interferon phi 2 precursor [Triplophysa rosa]
MKLQCITFLCSFFVCARVCSMPTNCHLRWKLVKSAHNLLKNMGGLFPRECLDENVEIKFPKSGLQSKGLNQKISVAKTVFKMMEHIDTLFANDTLPESWDQQKADNFQNIVYRLTEENRCILDKRHGHVDDFSARDSALKTYFEKLATLLRNKDNSLCAWEVIRKELLRVLSFVLRINSSKV